MDNLTKLGRNLKQSQDNANSALRRYHAEKPRVEHARDIFDEVTAFEMYFDTQATDGGKILSLVFAPPPNNCCCTQCYCAQCDFFTGTTDPVLTTTHVMIPDSIKVYFNDIQITTWTQTGDQEITLDSAPTDSDEIKICYTYEIAFSGPVNCDSVLNPTPVNTTFDINNPGNVTEGFFTANDLVGAIGCTFESSGSITWAHSTIPNWFGSAPDDTTDKIPINNLAYAIDPSSGTCASTPDVVLRNNSIEGGTVEVDWALIFNHPVRVCKIHIDGSAPSQIDVMTGVTLDSNGNITSIGRTNGVPATIAIAGGGYDITIDSGLTIWGLIIVMGQRVITIADQGPFGLFFYGSEDLCNIEVWTISARCIDLLAAGQL